MMSSIEFAKAIRTRLDRKPFQPFVIELDDGTRWIVGEPEALWYDTGGSAMYFRADGSFDFVDCDAVRQFLDLTVANAP